MPATTPTTRSICSSAPRWPKGSMRCRQARAARRQRQHAQGHHGACHAPLAGVKPSYSRPRVSDDNAFVESLFKTAKYRPEFPARGFADLEEARAWGCMTSCTGTTSIIATAASVMSRPLSATPGRIGRSWPHVIRPICRRANATPLAGQGIRATGHHRSVTLNPERDVVVNRDHFMLKTYLVGCMNQATTILTCSGWASQSPCRSCRA
jgi:hypothetical protein